MGWFSKKKGLDTPPSLDAPPPISSEDKQSFGLSEPDIPPIHSMSDMKQKEFRMKEFKIGSDEEVPLPPSELKEEKDALRKMLNGLEAELSRYKNEVWKLKDELNRAKTDH